jgi:hypothetical protein
VRDASGKLQRAPLRLLRDGQLCLPETAITVDELQVSQYLTLLERVVRKDMAARRG